MHSGREANDERKRPRKRLRNRPPRGTRKLYRFSDRDPALSRNAHRGTPVPPLCVTAPDGGRIVTDICPACRQDKETATGCIPELRPNVTLYGQDMPDDEYDDDLPAAEIDLDPHEMPLTLPRLTDMASISADSPALTSISFDSLDQSSLGPVSATQPPDGPESPDLPPMSPDSLNLLSNGDDLLEMPPFCRGCGVALGNVHHPHCGKAGCLLHGYEQRATCGCDDQFEFPCDCALCTEGGRYG